MDPNKREEDFFPPGIVRSSEGTAIHSLFMGLKEPQGEPHWGAGWGGGVRRGRGLRPPQPLPSLG